MDNESFFRLERKQDDFPFYNGKPVFVKGTQWLWSMVLVFGGFALARLLSDLMKSSAPELASMLFSVLMTGFMVCALLVVSGKSHWKALFRRFQLRDVGLVLVFYVIAMALSTAVGLVVTQLAGTSPANPAETALAENPTVLQFLLLVLRLFIQLWGEELLTILPLLALLWLGTQKAGMGRKTALIMAVVISSLLFGALHLPTYSWNFATCLLILPVTRVVLTLAYIRTKNILVCFLIHFLFDFLSFLASFFGAYLPSASL